jgi:hypothetical protein
MRKHFTGSVISGRQQQGSGIGQRLGSFRTASNACLRTHRTHGSGYRQPRWSGKRTVAAFLSLPDRLESGTTRTAQNPEPLCLQPRLTPMPVCVLIERVHRCTRLLTERLHRLGAFAPSLIEPRLLQDQFKVVQPTAHHGLQPST